MPIKKKRRTASPFDILNSCLIKEPFAIDYEQKELFETAYDKYSKQVEPFLAKFKNSLAWQITKSWEGPWKSYDKRDMKYDPKKGKNDDRGDFNPFGTPPTGPFKGIRDNYVGTSFGLTAQFMKEYKMWSDATVKARLPGMKEDIAAFHWFSTRWQWMQGECINDENIAALIFDFYVQSNNAAINKLKIVLSQYFGYSQSELIQMVMYEHAISPNHSNIAATLGMLTDKAVSLINALSSDKAKELFDKIVKVRLTVKNTDRTKAFVYGSILTQNEYESRNKRKLAKEVTTEQPTTTKTWLIRGAAVWVGGKIFKWW